MKEKECIFQIFLYDMNEILNKQENDEDKKAIEQAEELLHHLLEQNAGLVRIEELKEEMHRLNKAIRFYSME